MTFQLQCVEHLLVDLDGVLYLGSQPLPGADAFVSWIRRQGITFRLVTNNATLTPVQYVAKLAAMGIKVREDEIYTSALATASYLQRQGSSDQTAYVIGEEGLRDALRKVNVRIVEDRPQWVIVGLDRQVTYEKLARAALALQAGAGFIGTNPDTSLPTEQGLAPGAGALQVALTVTTGVKPTVIGKPRPLMLELAMEQLGGNVQNTAMLGDRLDTDIEAAATLAMPSILVLTGVSSRADIAHSSVQPSLVVNSLQELMGRWQGNAG